jgi:hypothetical protein
MSFPSPFPDKTPEPHLQSPDEPSGRGDRESEQELLESVLRQTKTLEDERADSADLRAAVEEVVRRYERQPRDWDPAVSNLVEVVLRQEFRERPRWARLWPSLSRQIAKTLWEDPHSRSQLELLWTRLSGG